VEAARGVEYPLAGAELVRQAAQDGGIHRRPRRDGRRAAQAQRVEAGLAADPARAGGQELALHRLEVREGLAAQVHVDDVVAAVLFDPRVVGVGEGVDLVGAAHDPLAVEEARRQLEVVAGRAHGDGHRALSRALPPEDGDGPLAVDHAPGPQADLQRLLGGELIGALGGRAVLHHPDLGLALAFRTDGHSDGAPRRLSFGPSGGANSFRNE